MSHIIDLSMEDKLKMNNIIGGLLVELEKIRTMVTRPFEFPEMDISTRVEVIHLFSFQTPIFRNINKNNIKTTQYGNISNLNFLKWILVHVSR